MKKSHSNMRYINKVKGMLSLEYALLITILVVALITIAIYGKRNLSGTWKQVADGFGYGRQYEPGVTR